MTTDSRSRVLAFSMMAFTCSAAVALSGLTGCATTESTSSATGKGMSPDERAAAVPPQNEEFAKLGYRLEWRAFPTMLPGEQIRRVELFGDVLAVQESAGVVSVIETRSGQVRWSDQAAGRLTKFLGINRDAKTGDRLILSSESEAFFYDISTGTLKARQKLALVATTKPVQVGDILVYGSGNGQILGHLMLNGFRQWGAGITGAIETPLLPIGTGRVAAVSSTGDIAVLDGVTGISQGRARIFAGPRDGVSMAGSETTMFVASADHSLYAFNAETAASLWRVRTDAPLNFSPTYHDNRVYCDMGKDGLSCLEANNGKVVWKNPDVHGTVVGIRNKRLLVWDGSKAVTLDMAKGSVVDSVELKNVSMLRVDNFVDGNLYAVSPAGIVAKLSPR